MRIHALNMNVQGLNLNCRQIHTCTLFMLAAKALVSLVHLFKRYFDNCDKYQLPCAGKVFLRTIKIKWREYTCKIDRSQDSAQHRVPKIYSSLKVKM